MEKQDKKEDARRYKPSHGSTGKHKGKKLWIIIFAAAAALITCLIIFAVLPMTYREEPKRAEVPEQTKVTGEVILEVEEDEGDLQPEILPEMKELYEQNSDLAGWIKIDGTVVDYPVMYTPDDGEFYLYRTFEKEDDPTKQGCIFIDKNCSIDPRSDNLLLHGHNMKNGTMFHTLIDYESEEFYAEHKIIEYSTLYSRDNYEIVSVFLSKVYNKDETDVFKFYQFYNAETEEEWDEFISNIKSLELYETGVTPEYGDELITLSTCEYSQENGRIVIVARRVNNSD